MKYKIEKKNVQETLILPLYSRKLCTELYPNLYRDETAVRLLDQIDYDFSEAEKSSRSLMQRFGALEVALRQQLLPAGDREQNIPCDLKDTAWFGKVDASGGPFCDCGYKKKENK